MTPDEEHDTTSQQTRPSAQRSQHNNGILHKVRHNITLQWPITNRSTSNPRRFSGQSAAQADSLACSHTGPLRASPDNRLRMTYSLVCSLAAGSHASPDNRLRRADSLAYSLTILRTIGYAGRTHSPTASPDLCPPPDNQQPAAQSGLTRRQFVRTTAHLRWPTTQAANNTSLLTIWPPPHGISTTPAVHQTSSATLRHTHRHFTSQCIT